MPFPGISPRRSIDYEKELNPQQLAVVQAHSGPMLVIAGAGSGKTRAVTYRVAYLIDSGVDPGHILLVTFTNKASREMLSRVEDLAPAAAGAGRRVWGGTFHHIGNRFLRRHAPLVGYQPNYTILDREDTKDLVEACVREMKIQPKGDRFPRPEVLVDLFSLAVNTLKPLEDLVMERYPFFYDLVDDIRAVAERFRQHKRELNVLDFDDLLFFWKALLRDHPDLRARYGDQFRHILVDEYQDTNRIQAEIVDLLAERHGNLMVVGDDAQSIYSFRGAHFANILTFPERYPAAKIFKLETNYRSTPEILRLANASIVHNREQYPKELQPIRPQGSCPAVVPVRDVLAQAGFVGRRIGELLQRGFPLGQIAVLYRAHYQSMEVQMELTRRGIPFEVRSGLRFFEQAHIKDVSAFLKILCNPRDELAWKRALQLYPRFGRATAEKVWSLVSAVPDARTAMESEEVQKKIPAGARESWRQFRETIARLREPGMISDPGKMIESVLSQVYEAYLQAHYPNYESREEDLRQLAAFARRYSSCQDFLSELALLTTLEEENAAGRGGEDGTVKLSSVHQAKGLEWPVVFLIWLADGRFPSLRSLSESAGEAEEEERRLFYVAVTRAKDELYLCFPRFAPDRGGREMIQHPSRFLAELSGEEYERLEMEERYRDEWED